jgi:cell division protein ZapE
MCIDEFQVLDIADAMILKRLFEGFWANKLIVCMTSNRPPEDLYLNCLQRDLFLPFIDDIKAHSHVINLSSIDYRLLNSMGMDNYVSKSEGESESKINVLWDQLTNSARGEMKMVEVA